MKAPLFAFKLGVIRRVTLEERHEVTVRAPSTERAVEQLAAVMRAKSFLANLVKSPDQEIVGNEITIGVWVDGEWVELRREDGV